MLISTSWKGYPLCGFISSTFIKHTKDSVFAVYLAIKTPFNLSFFLLQVFLVVELPLGIIVIFHTVASSLDLEFLNYYAIKCTLMILNMIISLSYPLNFGIYCGMSQQFRETFMKLFGARIPNMPKWCCRCKRENDSHTSVDAVSIYFRGHSQITLYIFHCFLTTHPPIVMFLQWLYQIST